MQTSMWARSISNLFVAQMVWAKVNSFAASGNSKDELRAVLRYDDMDKEERLLMEMRRENLK